MSLIKAITFLGLLLIVIACTSKDDKHQALADSLNSQCSISQMENEIEITGVTYLTGRFQIDIALHDEAPVSVVTLQALNEEYARRVQAEYDEINREMGGLPFIKGIISRSPLLMQMIDSIALATSTPESTQGYLPLDIRICDETDTLTYTYNEEWEYLAENEWLNAIMPMEMQKYFGWIGEGSTLMLNEEIRLEGFPFVSKDGYLDIHCSYDAMPDFRKPPVPMRLKDIKGKYFSEIILKDYLKKRKEEFHSIERFLKACAKRNLKIRFLLEGLKDGIDYDLASPQLIKEWESWGGNDTVVVAM